MATEFESARDAVLHLSREVSILRGDALASRILAITALLAVIKRDPDPRGCMEWAVGTARNAVAAAPIGKGDYDLNVLMMEEAENRIEEGLRAIAANLPPGSSPGSTG